MKQADFHKYTDDFLSKMKGRPTHRYRSFDYCYEYFRSYIGNVAGAKAEESCMRLWAYLASWGMLRGSSNLLNHNPSALMPLIERINKTPASYWDIDVPDYPNHIDEIVQMYCDIEGIITAIELDSSKKDYQVEPTDTLVTKIMLGVFGNIPAFDQYFKESFKSWIHSQGGKMPSRPKKPEKFKQYLTNLFMLLHKLYVANQTEIDGISPIQVVRFDGTPSSYCYSGAKLIDMWGFTKGLENNKS